MPFATSSQVPELPDGVYSIRLSDNQSDEVTFMAYTVQTGQLSGQRVLKMRRIGGWKAFANIRVTDDGEYDGLYTWRSMRDSIDANFVNNCAVAVRAFIGRVRRDVRAPFIVVDDCPVLPASVRTQNERRRVADAEARSRTQFVVTPPVNERRRTPLAMSFFDSSVVR